MPHVLAGDCTSLREFEGFSASRSLARGNTMPVLTGHSRLILLVFHLGVGVRTSSFHDVCRVGAELHTRAGAILLNFTSGLHSMFRFGLKRHKFATGLARGEKTPSRFRIPGWGQSSAGAAATRDARLPAEALSKG